MRICFYANLSRHENWREMFEKIGFYRLDIQLLRELGHEVVLSGTPSSLDWHADLYFCWWWGHAPLPWALSRLRRKPIVVTGAFDYATCRNALPGLCYLDRPEWQKLVLRAMLRLVDRNLFISRAEHDEVTENLKVRNPIVAPLAVDTSYYRPNADTARQDYFFSIAWSSRINAIRKGLPQTILAFARVASQLPSARLVIAGKTGDHVDALRALAAQHGVGNRVDFVGMIDDQEKLRRYRECVAYVQPTLYEAFGHAIAEAVSAGCRVISSNRGAVPEVAGPHAAIVDPDDIDEIAAMMVHAAHNPVSPEDADAAHQWIKGRYSLAARRKQLGQILANVT